MEKSRVLFLCTGNSARSQMAEAVLRKHAGDRYEVHSAGLEPKGMNPYTVRVMKEKGYDLSGHESKDLSQYLGNVQFDTVITVCANAEQRCPFLPGAGKRLHWPFDDPAEATGSEDEILDKFRAVRDQIEKRTLAWLSEQAPQTLHLSG